MSALEYLATLIASQKMSSPLPILLTELETLRTLIEKEKSVELDALVKIFEDK